MSAIEIVKGAEFRTEDGLPGPHSPRWFPLWTKDLLMDALEMVGVDEDTAEALVRKYPEDRIKRQLRALNYRTTRISRVLTLLEAIRNDRVLPSWMRDPRDLPPKSDYSGPYSTAKPWLETQADIAALLRKHGADGVQWGVSERLRQASVMFEKTIAGDGADKLLNVRIDLPLADDVGERNAAFRALYYYLKSKFDVIAFRFSDGSTLFDFESEFKAHLTALSSPRVDVALGPAAPLAISGTAGKSEPSPGAALWSEDLSISRESSTADRPRLRQIDQLLVRLLCDVGVEERKARALVARHRDRCEIQLAALPFRWRIKNRAEFIVRAIEDDLGIPPRIARMLERCSDEREFEGVPEAVRYRSELLVAQMISDGGVPVPSPVREQLERAKLLELTSA